MDDYSKRISILQQIFNDIKYSESKGEVYIFCPNRDCNKRKRKLQVNIQKNVFRCWVCADFKGHALSLIKRCGTRSQLKEYADTISDIRHSFEDKQHVVELPKDFNLLPDNSPTGILAWNYLKKHNIKNETIIQNKVGYCDSSEYILFPSYGPTGRLNYYVMRSLRDGAYKPYLDCFGVQKKSIIFNELFLDWSKPIVLVEGVKAYLRHFQQENIVPLLGSYLREDSKLFQDIVIKSIGEVRLWLDPDAYRNSVDIAKKLSQYDVNCTIHLLKDQPDNLDLEQIYFNCFRFSSDDIQTQIRAIL